MTHVPVWATMATVPERAGARAMAVESLLPQVDRLVVSFGHEKGDQVKFECCDGARGVYIVGVDDDLVYPPDYVESIVAGLREYGDGAVVGYHGFTINRDGERTATYSPIRGLDERVFVDVLGAGACAFHSDVLPLSAADFPTRNAAMFWVAVKAQQRGLPRIVLPHPDRWFTYIEHRQTMWSDTAAQTGYMDYSRTKQPAVEQLVSLMEWPDEEELTDAEQAEMVAA